MPLGETCQRVLAVQTANQHNHVGSLVVLCCQRLVPLPATCVHEGELGEEKGGVAWKGKGSGMGHEKEGGVAWGGEKRSDGQSCKLPKLNLYSHASNFRNILHHPPTSRD